MAALTTLLVAAGPATAQEVSWTELTADLTALVGEAEADDVRMGVSVVRLGEVPPGKAGMTVGSEEPYKAASVIKIPLLALLMDMVDQRTLTLDETTSIAEGNPNVVGGAGSLQERAFPIDIMVEELMRLMVQESDNTATNILIDRAGGFAAVNAYMSRLGYTTMWFGRKMMSTASEPLQQNWVSSTEIADMIARIHDHDLLSADSSDFIIDLMRGQTVDTKFGAVIPRDVLANKTGELGDVLHDSGIIFIPGNEVVLAVMTAFDPERDREAIDVYVQRAASIVYEHLQGETD